MITATRTHINILFWFYNFFILGCSVDFSSYFSSLPSNFAPTLSPYDPEAAILTIFSASTKNTVFLAFDYSLDFELIMPFIAQSLTKVILKYMLI
jgi:hypothetical protein